MGLCLAKPFAPASVLGAWMLGHGPDRTESLVVGAGRRKNKRKLCSLCVRLFTEFGIKVLLLCFTLILYVICFFGNKKRAELWHFGTLQVRSWTKEKITEQK